MNNNVFEISLLMEDFLPLVRRTHIFFLCSKFFMWVPLVFRTFFTCYFLLSFSLKFVSVEEAGFIRKSELYSHLKLWASGYRGASPHKDATSEMCLQVSFSFNTVGGIERKTKHGSSSQSCTKGKLLYLMDKIFAYMTAPLASKYFAGLGVFRGRRPTILSL